MEYDFRIKKIIKYIKMKKYIFHLISAFIFILVYLGIEVAIRSHTFHILERMGALGSWVSGVLALAVLPYIMFEFYNNRKIEAAEERLKLAIELSPRLHDSYIIILSRCLLSFIHIKREIKLRPLNHNEKKNKYNDEVDALLEYKRKEDVTKRYLMQLENDFSDFNEAFRETDFQTKKLKISSPSFFSKIKREIDFYSKLHGHVKEFKLVLSETTLGKGSYTTIGLFFDNQLKTTEENKLRLLIKKLEKEPELYNEETPAIHIAAKHLEDDIKSIKSNTKKIEDKLSL